jgi:uncharacterized membrane protein YhaH (DUF805 family)
LLNLFNRGAAPTGRLGQQGYVLMFTLPFLLTLALSASMFSNPALFAALGPVGIYGAAAGWLLLMGVGDALNIRRYHDLGHSGRLYRLCRPGVVVPLLAFALDFLIPAQMASAGDMEATLHLISESLAPTIDPAPLALLVLTVAGVAVNVVYLSLTPGQRGPNEYGPDPRGDVGAPDNGAWASKAAQGEDPVQRALREYQQRAPEGAAAPRSATPRAAANPPAGFKPVVGATFGKKR